MTQDNENNPDQTDGRELILALYEKVTGKTAELSDIFGLEHCARAIEQEFLALQDLVEQTRRVQKAETRIIQKLLENLLKQEIAGDNGALIRDSLEKGLVQCRRILEELPMKLGLPGEEEEDASAQLIDVILSAVTDPSLYDEFQGERSLSEWQQDAVLEAINQTGFDLVSEYDDYVDNDVEALKAELNIANALIERLYQRSFDNL